MISVFEIVLLLIMLFFYPLFQTEYTYCYDFMVMMLDQTFESRSSTIPCISVERPLIVVTATGNGNDTHIPGHLGNDMNQIDGSDRASVYSFDNNAFETEGIKDSGWVDKSKLEDGDDLFERKRDSYAHSEWNGMSACRIMEHYNNKVTQSKNAQRQQQQNQAANRLSATSFNSNNSKPVYNSEYSSGGSYPGSDRQSSYLGSRSLIPNQHNGNGSINSNGGHPNDTRSPHPHPQNWNDSYRNNTPMKGTPNNFHMNNNGGVCNNNESQYGSRTRLSYAKSMENPHAALPAYPMSNGDIHKKRDSVHSGSWSQSSHTKSNGNSRLDIPSANTSLSNGDLHSSRSRLSYAKSIENSRLDLPPLYTREPEYRHQNQRDKPNRNSLTQITEDGTDYKTEPMRYSHGYMYDLKNARDRSSVASRAASEGYAPPYISLANHYSMDHYNIPVSEASV